jgi:hypothetical protein
MSEFDLTNLVYMASERSANLLQFWLSASFAVVMASYFGRGKLHGPVFKLVAALYVIASVTFICFTISGSVQYDEYVTRMAEQGYETAHFYNIYSWIGGIGMLSLFVIGTLGVLYYLRWEFRNRNVGT